MKILRITARRDGYRRAGIAHPAHAVDHLVERFDDSELEQLRSDSGLVVLELEVDENGVASLDAEKKAEPAKGKKAGEKDQKTA